MTKNNLYKYSTLLTLLFSSGLLFFVVGQITNINYRYKIFDVFQIGTDQLFNLVYYKFNADLSVTNQYSYNHIAPLVNLISGFFWTLLALVIFNFIKKTNSLTKEQPTFWRNVFYTNTILSLLLFLLWVTFMDLDFINSGQYTTYETSNFKDTYDRFFAFSVLPAAIPELLSSLTLEKYESTTLGLYDSYLVAKTETSFGLTIWSIVGVYFYSKIKDRHQKKQTRI